MLRVACTAPLGAKGRFCLFSQARGVTPDLPRKGLRVSLPGQVGGLTDPAHLGVRHLLPGAEVSPHPGGHPGNRAGGAGLAVGQLGAEEQGCWRRGSKASLRALRASVWPVGVLVEHGVRPWPWQRE